MSECVCWTQIATPLGGMILASSAGSLIGAWFEGQAHFGGVQPEWVARAEEHALRSAACQLAEWFAGERRLFCLPLAPRGTEFQYRVWQQIAAIGFGARCDYGALAAVLGKPGAARAVGAATGRNPLSIIVPCHRLLGRGGSLTGYAGGLERKRALLAFESGQPWPDSEQWAG